MTAFRKLFEYRNRGILLDVFVFIFTLALMRILVVLCMNLVNQSDTVPLAKLSIGLFFAGLFLTSPLVLHQLWLFISPGLYKRERRYAVPFILFASIFFIAGGYFGARIALLMKPIYVRWIVILLGFSMAAYFFSSG